ncbi:MAG: glycoside hydrolase family 97 C-terminal domain-containing protein, partial [Asticcacaulis sp.]
TLARQLALYVVLYSPVQMAADRMENLARYPEPLKFIAEVPADWAETRVVNGEIGDYVTIARKDRHSDDWYIGAATDEDARTLEVVLDFLEDGTSYEAQIYRDADDTHYVGETRHNYVQETKRVRKGDRLMLKLAAGGGQVIRFAPHSVG